MFAFLTQLFGFEASDINYEQVIIQWSTKKNSETEKVQAKAVTQIASVYRGNKDREKVQMLKNGLDPEQEALKEELADQI